VYARLKDDPQEFDAIAREESDEDSALGTDGTGGLLPGYVSADSGYVPSFSEPILAAAATDGEILAPIRTEFGYHVVQVLHAAPRMDDIKQRADAGEDFAELARDLSDGNEAPQGGDLGWIARSQLDERLSEAIFGTTVGQTSAIVTLPGDGQYLFLVRAEAERTPDGRQEDQIRSRAFADWYDPKKAAAVIERDPLITGQPG